MMPRADAERGLAGLTELKPLFANSVCLRNPVLWAAACTVRAAEQLLRVYLAEDQPEHRALGRQALLEAIGDCRAATVAVAHALRDRPMNTAQTEVLSGSGPDLSVAPRPPGEAEATPAAYSFDAVPPRTGPLEDDMPATEVER